MFGYRRTSVKEKNESKHGSVCARGRMIKDAGSAPLSGWRYRTYEMHSNRRLCYYDGEVCKGEFDLTYCVFADCINGNPMTWKQMKSCGHNFTGKEVALTISIYNTPLWDGPHDTHDMSKVWIRNPQRNVTLVFLEESEAACLVEALAALDDTHDDDNGEDSNLSTSIGQNNAHEYSLSKGWSLQSRAGNKATHTNNSIVSAADTEYSSPDRINAEEGSNTSVSTSPSRSTPPSSSHTHTHTRRRGSGTWEDQSFDPSAGIIADYMDGFSPREKEKENERERERKVSRNSDTSPVAASAARPGASSAASNDESDNSSGVGAGTGSIVSGLSHFPQEQEQDRQSDREKEACYDNDIATGTATGTATATGAGAGAGADADMDPSVRPIFKGSLLLLVPRQALVMRAIHQAMRELGLQSEADVARAVVESEEKGKATSGAAGAAAGAAAAGAARSSGSSSSTTAMGEEEGGGGPPHTYPASPSSEASPECVCVWVTRPFEINEDGIFNVLAAPWCSADERSRFMTAGASGGGGGGGVGGIEVDSHALQNGSSSGTGTGTGTSTNTQQVLRWCYLTHCYRQDGVLSASLSACAWDIQVPEGVVVGGGGEGEGANTNTQYQGGSAAVVTEQEESLMKGHAERAVREACRMCTKDGQRGAERLAAAERLLEQGQGQGHGQGQGSFLSLELEWIAKNVPTSGSGSGSGATLVGAVSSYAAATLSAWLHGHMAGRLVSSLGPGRGRYVSISSVEHAAVLSDDADDNDGDDSWVNLNPREYPYNASTTLCHAMEANVALIPSLLRAPVAKLTFRCDNNAMGSPHSQSLVSEDVTSSSSSSASASASASLSKGWDQTAFDMKPPWRAPQQPLEVTVCFDPHVFSRSSRPTDNGNRDGVNTSTSTSTSNSTGTGTSNNKTSAASGENSDDPNSAGAMIALPDSDCVSTDSSGTPCNLLHLPLPPSSANSTTAGTGTGTGIISPLTRAVFRRNSVRCLLSFVIAARKASKCAIERFESLEQGIPATAAQVNSGHDTATKDTDTDKGRDRDRDRIIRLTTEKGAFASAKQDLSHKAQMLASTLATEEESVRRERDRLTILRSGRGAVLFTHAVLLTWGIIFAFVFCFGSREGMELSLYIFCLMTFGTVCVLRWVSSGAGKRNIVMARRELYDLLRTDKGGGGDGDDEAESEVVSTYKLLQNSEHRPYFEEHMPILYSFKHRHRGGDKKTPDEDKKW